MAQLDNFDTAYTKQLHIDFAKDTYNATNHKDEFTQMANWLERKEKIFCHEQYLVWVHNGSPVSTPQIKWQPPGLELDHYLHMAKHPTVRVVQIDRLVLDYGAKYFRPALACFIALTNEPDLTCIQLEARLHRVCIPFCSVQVWHHIRYLCEDPVSGATVTADSIHVQPSSIDYCGHTVSGCFNTALVNEGTGKDTGIEGEYNTLYMAKLAKDCQRLLCWLSASSFLNI